MLRSKSILAIFLALSFLFSRAHGFLDDRGHIGYAKVSASLAQQINSDNKPRVEESNTVQQVGPGLYLQSLVTWYEDDGDWYCTIEANKEEMKEIEKAWIPKQYESRTATGEIETHQLWGQDEEQGAILHYIKHEVMRDGPERVLRFSWVEGIISQMTIPTEVVNDDELELWGRCYESPAELQRVSDDYVDWEARWTIRSSAAWIWDPVTDADPLRVGALSPGAASATSHSPGSTSASSESPGDTSSSAESSGDTPASSDSSEEPDARFEGSRKRPRPQR